MSLIHLHFLKRLQIAHDRESSSSQIGAVHQERPGNSTAQRAVLDLISGSIAVPVLLHGVENPALGQGHFLIESGYRLLIPVLDGIRHSYQ